MNYKITNFCEITETGNILKYDLDILTGYYYCRTNNLKLTKTDFICMPNTYINSIETYEGPFQRKILLSIGTIFKQFGKVLGFRFRNSKLEVKTEAEDYTLLRVLVNWEPVVIKSAATNQNVEFATLEQKIIKAYPKPIRLEKFYKKNLPITVQEFLYNFFTKYNENFNTIFIDTKELQTATKKRRSLGDIFMICKYYYPQCTLQEVLTELYINLPKKFQKGFRITFCNTINKRVFYYSSTCFNCIENSLDEYLYYPNWYISKL